MCGCWGYELALCIFLNIFASLLMLLSVCFSSARQRGGGRSFSKTSLGAVLHVAVLQCCSSFSMLVFLFTYLWVSSLSKSWCLPCILLLLPGKYCTTTLVRLLNIYQSIQSLLCLKAFMQTAAFLHGFIRSIDLNYKSSVV